MWHKRSDITFPAAAPMYGSSNAPARSPTSPVGTPTAQHRSRIELRVTRRCFSFDRIAVESDSHTWLGMPGTLVTNGGQMSVVNSPSDVLEPGHMTLPVRESGGVAAILTPAPRVSCASRSCRPATPRRPARGADPRAARLARRSAALRPARAHPERSYSCRARWPARSGCGR